MSVHDNIRALRESKLWSQEDMAERMNMSINGYAIIERGETRLYLDRLEQIAQIFNMDILELLAIREEGALFLLSGHANNYNSNYYADDDAAKEIERLKLVIAHNQEIIAQKDNEIAALKEIIALLKGNRLRSES